MESTSTNFFLYNNKFALKCFFCSEYLRLNSSEDHKMKYNVVLLMFIAISVDIANCRKDIFGVIGDTLENVAGSTTGVVRGGLNAFEATISGVMNGALSVTERIKRLLEEFRRYMLTGIPEIGLPILDPLTVERIDINITNDELSLIGFVEDVRIKYLSKFLLEHINYKVSQSILELNMTFPQLDVKGYYDINGKVGMFNFFGKGRFWLRLFELSIGTISRIRLTAQSYPPFYVDRMKLTPKLKKLENNFEGLMNKKELGDTFNKAITRLAPAALDTLWPQIEEKVSGILISIINEKIQDLRISSIMGHITNMFKINLNQGKLILNN